MPKREIDDLENYRDGSLSAPALDFYLPFRVESSGVPLNLLFGHICDIDFGYPLPLIVVVAKKKRFARVN